MKLWAIVPVKQLSEAKSRLAPTLSLKKRQALVLALLQKTLDTLGKQKLLEGIIVAGKDPAVAALARKSGADFVREPPNGGLNRALLRAADEAKRKGAEGVMVLPADLPILKAKDLTWVMRIAHRSPYMVIVPDHTWKGTNCLVAAPPDLIPWCFGTRSFERHQEAARRKGVEPFVCMMPSLAEDIDRPEDLLRALGTNWEEKILGGKTRAKPKSAKRRARPKAGKRKSKR